MGEDLVRLVKQLIFPTQPKKALTPVPGLALTPADLFERMTPNQLVAVFFEPKRDELPDNIELLRRHNHDVRAKQGQRPSVPRWLWPIPQPDKTPARARAKRR